MALGDGLVIFGSQYWGKKETEPVRKISAWAMRTGIFIALILFFLASFFPRQLLGLFTTDQTIIEAGLSKSISGIGLMVGIEFYDLKAADVLAACREAGLLVLTAKTRLRLLPPLTLSEHDVDMALEILSDVLGKMEPTAPKEQA